LYTQAHRGQHPSFFHGNSAVHRSGDTYTKIYYFIIQEICEKQKKVYQDAIEIRNNLSK
jgi:hypothetical protein